VSSNFDRVIQGILKTYGWDSLGTQFVGLDGVTHAKPDPEMVLKAVQKLQLDVNECVMVGDSPADILAGHAAGTWTIAVCSSGNTPEDFSTCRPNMVLDSIADLLPLLPLELKQREI
jgi:pyrophosphatase PpaX